MLIGIVVTNAIVLLDLVERLRADGYSTRDALIEGGRTRLRPILMTAIATILALVPLAAGFNSGSIIAAELGTVVIGGLLSSTFLTLLVVPAVYSLIDGFKERATRRGASEVALAPIEPTAGAASEA
jgi:hydrophobic/amphiphilic exporter-1 (mainly G- bacteria), HAE1 family